MNVIGSRPDGWWRDRRGAMRRLVEELGSLASTSGEPVTVVLDGGPFDLDSGPVDVRFASRRGPNAADDDIAALVAARLFAARPAAWSHPTPHSSGACASTAPPWRARGRSAGGSTSSVADPRYRIALLDWLACAAGGAEERAARAAGALDDPVAAAATAGHVLDFDDTYLPGIAHLSAPTAPVALALAATVGDALDAYAAGFEAMGALARASHPALYDRGLHPTAVCGGVGAAVAAGRLLGLDAGGRALGRGARAARRGRPARRVRVGRQGAAGRLGGRGRRARRAARGHGGARAARGGRDAGSPRSTGGRYAEPGPVRAGDRAQLDQGVALLPPDARLDRGRRAGPRGGRASRRRWSCTRCRSRRRRWAPSRPTACRRSSRSPT